MLPPAGVKVRERGEMSASLSTVLDNTILPPLALLLRITLPVNVAARKREIFPLLAVILPPIELAPAPFCVNAPPAAMVLPEVKRALFVIVIVPPPVALTAPVNVIVPPVLVKLIPDAAVVLRALLNKMLPAAFCKMEPALKGALAVTLAALTIVTLSTAFTPPTVDEKRMFPAPAVRDKS